MVNLPDPNSWQDLVASGADLFPWIVVRVARDALSDPSRGYAWIDALIRAPSSPPVTRAYLAKESRAHLSPAAVEAVTAVLADSTSGWARLGACQALQGPWGAPGQAALEAALDDVTEIADLDFRYRVSDEAAMALHAAGVAPLSRPFRVWRARTLAELEGGSKRELAAIALARLGDRRATVILHELAASSDPCKAVLARLDP